MSLIISRESLLTPLQFVAGGVEKRQTLPILSNVLLTIQAQQISLTATDMEIELIGRMALDQPTEPVETTIPARKLLDIVRALPEGTNITFDFEPSKVSLKAGRGRYTLACLPANEFPNFETTPGVLEFAIKKNELKKIIQATHFAMAQQDVRYYLNGLLLDVGAGLVKGVATDGHRLAMAHTTTAIPVTEPTQAILPRKGAGELLKLLSDDEEMLDVTLGSNHIRVTSPDFTFTSKLIDGRFPDYRKAIPDRNDKIITCERDILKQALLRVAVLSSDQYHSIRLQLQSGLLQIATNNPDQELAEEEVEIDYQGPELEVAFNVSYLLDVLNAVEKGPVKLSFSGPEGSLMIESNANSDALYVIMPMRL